MKTRWCSRQQGNYSLTLIEGNSGSWISYKLLYDLSRLTLFSTCRHNSDWTLWKARVTDIILGCLLAMGVSWLVLPWFTSDEHLCLLGNAYTSAGKLVDKMYNTFYEACQSTSEVVSLSWKQEFSLYPTKCLWNISWPLVKLGASINHNIIQLYFWDSHHSQ